MVWVPELGPHVERCDRPDKVAVVPPGHCAIGGARALGPCYSDEVEDVALKRGELVGSGVVLLGPGLQVKYKNDGAAAFLTL